MLEKMDRPDQLIFQIGINDEAIGTTDHREWSFLEGKMTAPKTTKALLFLAGLSNKWRSGRDSNPRPPA